MNDLVFTRTIPSRPGFYWIKRNTAYGTVTEVVWVLDGGDGRTIYSGCNSDVWYPCALTEMLWAGPLEKP